MTLAETLIALRRCGVRRIRFDMKKQRILFNAKPGAVSPELGEALTRHKAAILALMRRGVTRPTIADLEAAEAEAPDLPLRRPVDVDGVRIAALLPLPRPPAPPSLPPITPPIHPDTWYTADECDAWLTDHDWRRDDTGEWCKPDAQKEHAHVTE